MSEVRLIDANALLDHLVSTLDTSYCGTPNLRWKCREVEEAIRNAPIITPEGDRDAISRKAVLNWLTSLAMSYADEPKRHTVALQVSSYIENLPPLPDAFRLASRLAAALEGQPCPKCAELRAENERLRGALGRVVKSGDDLYLGISIHNNRKKDCRVEGPVIEIHRKELKVAREALSPTEQTQENEPK